MPGRTRTGQIEDAVKLAFYRINDISKPEFNFPVSRKMGKIKPGTRMQVIDDKNLVPIAGQPVTKMGA